MQAAKKILYMSVIFILLIGFSGTYLQEKECTKNFVVVLLGEDIILIFLQVQWFTYTSNY